MKTKKVGFIVVERRHDDLLEQPLALRFDEDLPDRGVLDWLDEGKSAFVFPNRKAARAAIKRTFHYTEAFGLCDLPSKASCAIVPLEMEAVEEDAE